jgi:hypothetical protein
MLINFNHIYNTVKVNPNPISNKVIIDNGNFLSMNNYIVKIEDGIGR